MHQLTDKELDDLWVQWNKAAARRGLSQHRLPESILIMRESLRDAVNELLQKRDIDK